MGPGDRGAEGRETQIPPQKHYWENFKFTNYNNQFWILQLIIFVEDEGYLIKLLSNH